MRYALLILTLCFSINLYAQSPKTNNIKEVKTLNIYGHNNKTIIGEIIINESLPTKIFLESYSQIEDSSNIFTTTIICSNKSKMPVFNVDINLKFDRPVIDASGSPEGMSMGVSTEFSGDKSMYHLSASQITPAIGEPTASVIFTIKSYYPTKTTITGVDGILKK